MFTGVVFAQPMRAKSESRCGRLTSGSSYELRAWMPRNCLELNRQLGAHSEMALPPRQLPFGLVTKNQRPVLESAGPADAAGAFRILVTSPEVLFFFGKGPQLEV